MKLLEKISQLFLEDVEEEVQYDEKTNKIQSKTVKPIKVEKEKRQEVKKETTTVKEQQPKVEEVVKEEKKDDSPTFLNVSNNTNSSKVEKTETTVSKKEKNVYLHSGVISPIYGSSSEVYTTKKNDYDLDNTSNYKSVLNTVFSPINGDGNTQLKETTDVVDERIANMTIDDFLTEIDENQVKRITPPVLKKEVEKKEEKEVTNNSEALTIENLSLFDDFKESE